MLKLFHTIYLYKTNIKTVLYTTINLSKYLIISMKKLLFLFLLCSVIINAQAQGASIISTNRPTYKIGDTIQLRGNGIKTLKLKSFASRDSFVITNFITKIPINSDTNYTFIVPNTVKNDIYLINAFSYTNQLSDSIRLVRFFVIPSNIDSLGVIGWGSNGTGQISIPVGLNNVIQISAGDNHSLSLKADGTVVAWGYNYYGQTSIPVGLNNVIQISAGGYHSLALKGDGTVVAWGWNIYGQTNIPVGLNNVVQIAAGYDHSMALKSDGTIIAWGSNIEGQTNIPVGLSKVIQISAGGNYLMFGTFSHSIALKSDGTIVAWGSINVPVGLSNIVQIDAGGYHAMALKLDSTVVAWGSNGSGQTNIPAGLNNVVQIAGGRNHSLTLKADGTVVAWGDNSNGQTTIPVGLNNVVQITAGGYHNLALTKLYINTTTNTGGTITPTTFVKNGDKLRITYQPNSGYFVDSIFINGVLNTDSLTGYTFNNINQYQNVRVVFNAYNAPSKPRNVVGIGGNKKAILNFLPPTNFGSRSILKYIAKILGTNIKDSSTNTSITLTGLNSGQAYNITVQAVNNEGLISDTALVPNIVPIPVTEIISTNRPTYKIGDTIQLRGNGIKTLQLKSFASRDSFVITNFISKTPISSDTNYTFIVPNTVKNDVYLINAFNYTNQLSDSQRLVRFFVIPRDIDSLGVIGWGGQTSIPVGLNNVIQISAGDNQNLALKADGTVVALAYNGDGQLSIPVGLNNVIQISAGGYHSLALKADGTVVAWGNNEFGQISIPAGLNNVVQITAGYYHSMALKSDGTIVAWGRNIEGQTNIPVGLSKVIQISAGGGYELFGTYSHSIALKSDGTIVAWGSINVPVGLSNIVQIDAGGYHAMALKLDSTVVAWGSNGSGQTNIPAGLNNVVQIAGGRNHSLALKGDGTVVAWGSNFDGETNIPVGLNNAVQITAGGSDNLALTKLYINTTTNTGGTITPTTFVKNGDKLRITYQPNSGYFKDSIFINGVLNTDSITGYTFNNINQYQTVRVVFTPFSAPSKPRNVIGIGGNKKAILSFLPPTNFGSKSIVKYIAKVLGTNIKDSSTNTSITLTGLNSGQAYNITVQAVNNEGLISDTALVPNIVPINGTEIISTNKPSYKIGDTIQLRGNGIKTLKLKSFASRDSFVVNTFISKLLSNTDTLYNFIVPNTVKNDVYLINAFSYTNQLSDSIRLVRFFVIPSNIDSLGVIGWGDNSSGQTNIPPSLNKVVQLAAMGGKIGLGGPIGYYYYGHSLALKAEGTVVAWGSNLNGQTNIPAGLNYVVQVSGGWGFSSVLKADGTVVAWGANLNGQTSIPAGLNNVVQIAGGDEHNLALKVDGTVVAWGHYGYGQTNIPIGLNNVVQIAGGGYHSIALKADGTVVAWGNNGDGQTSIPIGLNNVVQVAAGVYHSLALKGDGIVVAWGRNSDGQTTIPAGLNNVAQISAGGYHSLALKGDGTVVAWGRNGYGQTSIPADLNNVVQIAGGGYHNLALTKLYINTTTNTGGTITPTTFVKNGDKLRITYQPNPGYFIDSIFINGALNTDSLTGYTFNNINQYQTVRVVFTPFSAPSKPRNVIATAGNKKAILNFLPPTNFGSISIVKYIAKVLGTNIKDSSTNTSITLTGLNSGQAYNITVQAVNNEGLISDTALVPNIVPINGTEIISTNRPTYKIGDTIQLRGNGIKTLKLKSFASRDSFVVNTFISKLLSNTDTLYNFIVPNMVKNDVYLINAFSYTNQLSDSIRLVRFFVIPRDIDSLGVIGWGRDGIGQTSIPVGLNNVIQISAGDNHSLALKADGTVVAWAYNGEQLSIPVGLNNVIQISAGGYHSLALKADGTVVAWGNNSDRQISIPAGLNNVVQIAAGYYHSMALKSDGTIVAWGRNIEGQTNIPVGLRKVIQISAGGGYELFGTYSHSIALKSDGTIVAWGSINVPVGLSNIVQIDAGGYHAMALKLDSTVAVWGSNNYSQLNVPVGLSNVVQIAGGWSYCLALKGDGTVVAWGSNFGGETNIPVGLNNAVQITAGGSHNLALTKLYINTTTNTGGTITPTTFVKNGDKLRITYQPNPDYFIDSIFINGALNTDSLKGYTFNNINKYQNVRVVFTPFSAPSKPRNVIATAGNKKAILNFSPPTNFGSRSIVKYIAKVLGTNIKDSSTNTSITLTGLNSGQAYNITVQAVNNEGLISDTALVPNIVPINGTEIISTNRPNYKIGDTIQLRGNGIKTLKLKSFASRDSFEITNFITKTPINSDTNYTFIVPNTVKNDVYLINAFSYTNQLSDSIRLVRFFVIPRDIDSLGVIGWGSNIFGQTSIPTGLNNVVQITGGGGYHNLALKADGTVVSWGNNGSGQTTIPAGLNNVVQVAAGQYYSLALKADGTVVAWGYNDFGQTNIPADLNNVVQISAGYDHSLALKVDGKVVSWGNNGYGQTNIPIGLNNVMQVAAGGYHSIALKGNGTVVSWGYNDYGQTTIPAGLNNVAQISAGRYHSLALNGDGTVVAWGNNPNRETSIPVGLNNVAQISAGGYHSLALKGDGNVDAWGSNYFGERNIPVGLNNAVQITAGGSHNLALTKLYINTTSNTGGTITPTTFVKNGDKLRITYQPNPGYFIDSIFINGVLNTDSITGYTFNNINKYQNVRVVFNAYNAPSKPRNVVGIGGNKKAILSFLPPTNFGSKNIVKYIAKVLGTNIKDSSTTTAITLTGLTIGQAYNITVQAVNNEGLISDTALVPNIVPITVTEIISTNRPTYKIGDTIQLRGNGIKSLKLKSFASRDSFVITNFITKIPISSDTNYTFIVPNTVKNDVYLINAFSYTNQLSDSIRLVRFFVIPSNIDSLGVIGSIYGGILQVVGGGTIFYGSYVSPDGLALKADGTVIAWGNNNYGQINIPVGLNKVVQISAGGNHSLALKADGTVVAWGDNYNGQINIPAGLNNVVQIAAGGGHSLALKVDGSIVAWGV